MRIALCSSPRRRNIRLTGTSLSAEDDGDAAVAGMQHLRVTSDGLDFAGVMVPFTGGKLISAHPRRLEPIAVSSPPPAALLERAAAFYPNSPAGAAEQAEMATLECRPELIPGSWDRGPLGTTALPGWVDVKLSLDSDLCKKIGLAPEKLAHKVSRVSSALRRAPPQPGI